MNAKDLWLGALPSIRESVTGKGVWSALNAAVPIALEQNVMVLGIPAESAELASHLRSSQTQRQIEVALGRYHTSPISIRVVMGATIEDWEAVKRRDVEAKKIYAQADQKVQLEKTKKQGWDELADELARMHANVEQKSLPQNRARYLIESIKLLIEARREAGDLDDLGQRGFARCIEKVAQYTDTPSSLVALRVLESL